MAFMGFRTAFVILAALSLAPGAARAQQGTSLQDFRLDPSRDTNRPAVPERAGPEIDNRPPAPLPVPPAPENQTAPVPAPVPAQTPPPVTATVPAAPARTDRPTPQAAPPGRTDSAPATAAPAPEPVPERPADAQQQAPVEAPPTPEPQAAQPAAPPPTASAPASPFPMAWIGGALALLALAGIWLWRRRGSRQDRTVPAAEPIALAETSAETTAPVETPMSAAAAPTGAPRVESPPPPVIPTSTDRALIEISFHPESARATLVGAAVGYRLVLRNSGRGTARDVAVAALIANADARQSELLAAFFDGPVDRPTHRVASIAPGESVTLRGELRLSHDAIVPIKVRDRSLLIPVLAFNARYGWGGAESGQTAAAFIVGQENEPPRDKMAPFRLDQGPRQYRGVGSRPAQGVLVA